VTRNNIKEPFGFFKCNESALKPPSRINWRASLVPAAAVIPAPIANTNSAAVKKLVVELLVGRIRPLGECPLLAVCLVWPSSAAFFIKVVVFHCKKIRVFQAKVIWNILVWDDKIGSGCYFVGLHN
jgi:hypothetical protein